MFCDVFGVCINLWFSRYVMYAVGAARVAVFTSFDMRFRMDILRPGSAREYLIDITDKPSVFLRPLYS